MIFWICILIGGAFTWLAVRMGFLDSLTLLFNITISVYVAVFLVPVTAEKISAVSDLPYGNAFALTFIATGTFLVLFGISYVFLTGQFKVSFPGLFELVFAGLLGFLTGFLVSSFVALIITASPLSQNSIMSKIGFNRKTMHDNISYICLFCDSVNRIVSSSDKNITSGQIINEMLESVPPKEPSLSNPETEPKQYSEPNDPNES
ncbi:MAG: CvpA family protein [Sedimentisphaerales bacterium]|nr:CvpA family protein [Sedimentisphaerales bacterium]